MSCGMGVQRERRLGNLRPCLSRHPCPRLLQTATSSCSLLHSFALWLGSSGWEKLLLDDEGWKQGWGVWSTLKKHTPLWDWKCQDSVGLTIPLTPPSWHPPGRFCHPHTLRCLVLVAGHSRTHSQNTGPIGSITFLSWQALSVQFLTLSDSSEDTLSPYFPKKPLSSSTLCPLPLLCILGKGERQPHRGTLG